VSFVPFVAEKRVCELILFGHKRHKRHKGMNMENPLCFVSFVLFVAVKIDGGLMLFRLQEAQNGKRNVSGKPPSNLCLLCFLWLKNGCVS
jgi:hypothetical protein